MGRWLVAELPKAEVLTHIYDAFGPQVSYSWLVCRAPSASTYTLVPTSVGPAVINGVQLRAGQVSCSP